MIEMKREGNKLIFGKNDCHWCNEGKRPRQDPCTKCKGTGNGPRGGKGKCRQCFGSGKYPNFDALIPCDLCHGNYVNSQEQTYTDNMPKEIWQGLEFRVYRHRRLLSGNETLLGSGCVYSVSGGNYDNVTDEDLCTKVKNDTMWHQACKVATKEGILCNHVGIFVAYDGYSVRAVFDSLEKVENTIASERGFNDYMQTGMKIAAHGGNGTIGAIYK